MELSEDSLVDVSAEVSDTLSVGRYHRVFAGGCPSVRAITLAGCCYGRLVVVSVLGSDPSVLKKSMILRCRPDSGELGSLSVSWVSASSSESWEPLSLSVCVRKR